MGSLCVCMFVWLNFQWLCVCILVWMLGYVCVCPCACVILRVVWCGYKPACLFFLSFLLFSLCVYTLVSMCACCLHSCLCLNARMPVTTFCSLPFQSSMRLLVFMYKWFRICKRVCLFCCTAICLCYHLPVFLLVCVSVRRNLFANASFVPYVLSAYLPVSLYA